MKKRIISLLLCLCMVLGMVPAMQLQVDAATVKQAFVAAPSGMARTYVPIKMTWRTTTRVSTAAVNDNIRDSYIELLETDMVPTNAVDVGNRFWEDPVVADDSIRCYFGIDQLQKGGGKDGELTAEVKRLPEFVNVKNNVRLYKFAGTTTLFYQNTSGSWVQYASASLEIAASSNKIATADVDAVYKPGEGAITVGATGKTVSCTDGTVTIPYDAWMVLKGLGLDASTFYTYQAYYDNVTITGANSTQSKNITGVTVDETNKQIKIDAAAFAKAYQGSSVSFVLRADAWMNDTSASIVSPTITLTAAHPSTADDGNCTTAVNCSGCGIQQTAALTHTFDNDADATCNNAGCTYKRSVHDHDGTAFESLSNWTQLESGGRYYLTDASPAVSGNLTVAKNTQITLCLNGKDLELGDFSITNRGDLTICDCTGSGSISGTETCLYNLGVLHLSGGTVTSREYKAISNSGDFTLSDGMVRAKEEGIYNLETGTVTMTGGVIHSDFDSIYSYGAVVVSGGELVAGAGIALRDSGSVIFSGGTITGETGGILNFEEGSITVTGGTITGGDYGINNGSNGDVSISGGEISGKSYAVFNSQGTVKVTDGIITGSSNGLYNNGSGSVTMTGGTVTSRGYGITNKKAGTVSLSGGTVEASEYGIYDQGTGSVYLSGAPAVSGGSSYAAIYSTGSLYAKNQEGTAAYTGGTLTVELRSLAEGKVVVDQVTDSNRESFSLVRASGYTLEPSGSALVLKRAHAHIWATEWTANATHHWHVCTAEGCDIVDYSGVIASGFIPHNAAGICDCGGVVVNEENFPDDNFRSYLAGLPGGTDGFFTADELTAVEKMTLQNMGIATLKGIAFFTELKNLDCCGNSLTALDLSGNKKLTKLICTNNALSGLDLSANAALEELFCEYCTLTTLDVRENVNLKKLHCQGNQLSSIDVSENILLEDLNCYGNGLTALDVSKNTELTMLDCSDNELTKLDVSKNRKLTQLNCDANHLVALDLTQNTALNSFSAVFQTVSITIDQKTMSFDMKTLDSTFDGSKAAVDFNIGGSLSDSVLTVDQGRESLFVTHKTGYTDGDGVQKSVQTSVTVTNPHTHKALDDDGSCLTAVLCACDKVMVEARDAHTSTGDNVATYLTAAKCDVCGMTYGDVLPDEIRPTGKIEIGDNSWLKFWNTVTFGLFCKDHAEVTVTGTDGETGVRSIAYYLSDDAVPDTAISSITGWKTYTGKIRIDAERKVFVYAKITDNAENVTYLSADGGVVVFQDAQITGGVYDYTLTTKTDIVTDIKPGGNTVDSIDICEPGGGAGDALDFTVNDDGFLVLRGDSIDAFAQSWPTGDYAVTVFYNALGEVYVDGSSKGDRISDTVLTLHVKRQSVAKPAADSAVFTYTGAEQTYQIPANAAYTITNNKRTAAGKQTVTVALKDKHNYQWTDGTDTDLTFEFAIGEATFTAKAEQDGELIYNGAEQTAAVKITATGIQGSQMLTCKYGLSADACTGNTVPAFKNAGTYTVYFVASAPNHNDATGSFTVTIDRKEIGIDWQAPGSLVYDATAKEPMAWATGLVGSDTLPLSVALSSGNDNVNAGTFTYKVTDLDNRNYKLPANVTSPVYTIVPRTLQKSDFSAMTVDLIYDGAPVMPALIVENSLVSASDYEAVYQDNINAGENTAMILITGRNNASGTVEIPFSIAKANPNVTFPPQSCNTVIGGRPAKLADVALPAGFTWDNLEMTVVYGEQEFDATYTPADTRNYNILTGKIKVVGMDVTAPTGTVTIRENTWNSFLNTITFDLFFKETQTVTVTAADTESGVRTREYLLADKVMDEAELQSAAGWVALPGSSFNIDPDNEYVVYVRVTDEVGNACIINSDGVVLDSIAPAIGGIENGKTYYGDTAFTAADKYAITVTVDGEPVTLDQSGAWTIPADNEAHTVEVTDQAGNKTAYTVTVCKYYTVTYLAEGSPVSTQQVGYQCDAVAPEIPAKEGYDQTAPQWDHDGKGITEDTAIHAVYTINTYTVTYMADGQVVDVQTVEHGSDAVAPQIPVKEGYSMTAPQWDRDGKNITADTTVTALYTQDIAYNIIEGAGQTVTQGEAAAFTSNAPFQRFAKVQVDGKDLTAEDYTAAEGSTKVTLTADFVGSLPVGEHSIVVFATDGIASAAFTVAAPVTPETGDSSMLTLWILLLALSCGAMILLAESKRRKMAK